MPISLERGQTSKAYRDYDKKRFHDDGPDKDQIITDTNREIAKSKQTYTGKVYSPNSLVRKPTKINI